MVSAPLNRIRCETCDVKIPKTHPKLRCTFCNELKHLACQKLSKSDANYLICMETQWICRECILEILPIGGCLSAKPDNDTINKKFKVKCFCCNGFSYSPRNVRTCEFCMNQVHLNAGTLA